MKPFIIKIKQSTSLSSSKDKVIGLQKASISNENCIQGNASLVEIKSFPKKEKNSLASIAVALALSGCTGMNTYTDDPVIAEAQQQKAVQELRQAIIDAKNKCKVNTAIFPEYPNFMRVICENREIKKVIAQELDKEDLAKFDGFFVQLINIADQIDRGEITLEQSNWLIHQAQIALLKKLKKD